MQARFRKQNNLDLVRLLAALQVAIMHGVEHLGLHLPFHELSLAVLKCFPGVPIFFIISGFLISASYQRSISRRDFIWNRVLRLFPALWLCFVVTVLLVFASGYFVNKAFPVDAFILWGAAQLSFLQFFNPDFLRDFGVGAVNGSLWTIPVEMQFYLLTPFIVWVLIRSREAFIGLIILFAMFNFVHNWLPADWEYRGIIKSLAAVSFMPWVYMFMIGVLLNVCWGKIEHLIVGKFGYWLAAYLAVVSIELIVGVGAVNNKILLPWVLVLAGLTLSSAFSSPELASRLLRGNDISYGLYIYHMPVYNFILEAEWFHHSQMAWLAIAFTMLVAAISWRLVEKPALQLKNYSLRRAAPAG